jgi:uncharacterized membrane protein YhaH (DUF805 family)
MKWFKFALKRYGQFEGRASRPEFWYFFLIILVIFLALTVVDNILDLFSDEAGLGLFSGLFMFSMIVPSLATGARRLHDTGRSGWWQLVNVLPYVGPVILFVLLAIRGDSDSNDYGSPPDHSPG